MKRFTAPFIFAAALVSPLSALAQTAGSINTTYIQGYATSIGSIINGVLVPLLVAVAFIVFIWGVFNYFIRGAADPAKRSEGAQFVLWGIIGFVIIFSLWGIVQLFQGTLGLSAQNAPTPPTLGNIVGGSTSGTITGYDSSGNPIYSSTPVGGTTGTPTSYTSTGQPVYGCNGTTNGDGTAGSCCIPPGDCDGGLVCGTGDTCQAPAGASSGFGQNNGTVEPGGACEYTGDCADDGGEPHVCTDQGICQAADAQGDCADGLNDCY